MLVSCDFIDDASEELSSVIGSESSPRSSNTISIVSDVIGGEPSGIEKLGTIAPYNPLYSAFLNSSLKKNGTLWNGPSCCRT